jgi:hypothetical protein
MITVIIIFRNMLSTSRISFSFKLAGVLLFSRYFNVSHCCISCGTFSLVFHRQILVELTIFVVFSATAPLDFFA